MNRRITFHFVILLMSVKALKAQVTQNFIYTGTIQTYTVPACVTSLTIQARGAEGGFNPSDTYTAGMGALIRAVVCVTPGQVYRILVGQNPNDGGNGGGGGSFVTTLANVPVLVAGGGGGSSFAYDSPNKHGQISTAAQAGAYTGGAGGTAGGGGGSGTNGFGGGGGGLLLAGANGNNAASGGLPFVAGGAGGANEGWSVGPGAGGFGSGGGGGFGGGGGGGYSGGGAGGYSAVGGGGGSYYIGTLISAVSGTNLGHGLITISHDANACGPFVVATPTCLTNGTATINIPYGLYSWTGSAQTTSAVTGLAPGIHSVTVSDIYNCRAPITRTVDIVSSMSLTASGSSCATTNSAAAFVTGGVAPFTYTWTGTAQTTSMVTNLATGVYTVTAASACQSRTATVNITASSSIAVTNTALCIGYSTTMTAITPLVSYSWTPIANILSSTNSPTVAANPTVTTIYTVSGTNSVNCVSSNTLQLFVVPSQTVPILNATTCVGSTLQLVANTTYTGSSTQWSGPSAFTSTLQNPTRTPATLAMSGPYSVTVISAPGCTSSAVANVTVFPIPASPSITSNAPVCSGFQLNLNGSGGTSYFWQGPNTFTSNLQNVAIANVTNNLHSGVYTLTARFATGCSNTFTRNILVRALPVPTITSNSPVCLGSTLTLFGTGGVSYAWTGPNTFASGVQNPALNPVSFASAGVYSVTSTDGFGCQGSITRSITVLGNPTITAVNGSTVCYGYEGLLTITAAGAGSYTWNGPGGTFGTQNPTVTAVNNLSSGVYTITVGNALSSCTAQSTATLATIALPVITATGTSVCYGQSATLLSNGAQSYTWSGPSAFTTNLQNPTINPVTNLTINTYTVAGTALNSCTASAIATLQALPNPTVTTTGTSVCFGASAILFAGGGAFYSWTGPGGYTSATQNPIFPSVTNITTDTYTVIVMAINSCTSLGTATLATKTNPVVTTTIIPVCLNSQATLSASASLANTTFSWTGPGGYAASGSTANVASATSAAPQTYTVVGTAPNSCTHQVTANLNTLPLPTVTATGTLICLNQPFTLSASGATSYVWSGPSIPGTVSSPTVFIPNVDSSSVGNYVVIGTGLNTCTNIATANISTLALPSIIATGTTVCYGKPATLKATGGIQSGYTWTGPSNYSYTLANAYVSSADFITQGIYTVVGTAPNSCTNSATDTLRFYTLPIPSFTAPQRVCVRGSIILYASGATTYTWTGPYNYLNAVPNVTIPVYNTLQGGIYTLSVNDHRGCYNDTTVNITIDAAPGGVLLNDNINNQCAPYCANFTLKSNADGSPITNISWLIGNKTFTGTTFNYCIPAAGITTVIGTFTNALGCSNKVNFEVKAHPKPIANFEYLPFNPTESVDDVRFTNTSQGDDINQWEWHFVNNKGYQSKEEHPTYIFEDAGTYPVAMVASNKWGCMDTVIKTVVVDADFKLYVPNAFTPDGDGLNDIFQPKGRGIAKYHLTIYDRWGRIVYQSEDFTKGWDGGEKEKQLTDEIFTWRIYATDVNGKIKELTGYVTLVR